MPHKLAQLTEHVWLWPHNPDAAQSCVGVIAGASETILVDAGNSPTLARRIQEELALCGLPPVSQVIYTHHHWDHIYGACEFRAPVVAHALCKTILAEEARKPWGPEYLRQEMARNPRLEVSYTARGRAVQDWAAFRIVVPEIVFDEALTLQAGQIEVQLEHVGGQHAGDSLVVKVPQEGVMFLGDCYYLPPLHLRTPASKPSMAMLAALESEAYALYVEGHDKPLTRAKLLRILKRYRV